MVQSSRLTKHFHPLIPVITILLLIGVFLLLYKKPLEEKLFSSYSNYKNQRSAMVDTYNTYKSTLNEILELPYTNISSYRANLTKAGAQNTQVELQINRIITLDQQVSERFASAKENLEQDKERLSKAQLLDNAIKNKINAIDVYQSILNFDKCLRNAKTTSNLNDCKVIYTGIKSPATVSSDYKSLADKLLSSFFSYSKNERTKIINKLVPYHNKMINSLEVIINSPISL